MKILITGAQGFIGKNLVAELNIRGYDNLYLFEKDTEESLLERFTKDCDFVFHLAGVNRPQNISEFMEGNYGLTSRLLELLKKHNNICPVMISSSIQADLDNPYGKSKRVAEDLLFAYGNETGAKVLVYRLSNVFGKWCRPNYNSVIATFCHNVANGLPIRINDRNTELNLVYIDDVLEEFLSALEKKETREGEFCAVPVNYYKTLGQIADLIHSFKASRGKLNIPDMSDRFTKQLYSTYLSYLPKEEFSYVLKMNVDHRGSFTEFIRTVDRGQISINVSKPGIVKGNHWHHTKNEKFLVVSGKGVIRFRRIDSKEVTEYFVSGDILEVVDIPVGYTHNIENLGDTDLVTIMWANESFDLGKPDTYFLEV